LFGIYLGIGITRGSKGMMIYIPETGKVEVSLDVDCDETFFPSRQFDQRWDPDSSSQFHQHLPTTNTSNPSFKHPSIPLPEPTSPGDLLSFSPSDIPSSPRPYSPEGNGILKSSSAGASDSVLAGASNSSSASAGDNADSKHKHNADSRHVQFDANVPQQQDDMRITRSRNRATPYSWQLIGNSSLDDVSDKDLAEFCLGESVCFVFPANTWAGYDKELIGSVIDTRKDKKGPA
jgi:hypothetical protein